MAYILATLVQKDPPGSDGRVRIIVEFTGDAGEPPRRRERYIENETLAELKTWARNEAIGLFGKKALADALVVGATVNLTPPTPPTPPVPTAAQVWTEKARRLARLRAMGVVTGPLDAAITALTADVVATYQAGFVDGM